MEKKNKYSIRKFKVGVGSVLIGFALAGGVMTPVYAAETGDASTTTTKEIPNDHDTYETAAVKDYLITENVDQEYGQGDTSEPNANRRVTIEVGTKPVVEDKVVDGKDVTATTNYMVRYPLLNAETPSNANNDVVEATEAAKTDNYKELVIPYEEVTVKNYTGPQDALILQGFGEEGKLDLNKFLEPISNDWNKNTVDTKRAVEFRFTDDAGNTTYFRVFPGADGSIRPDDLIYRDASSNTFTDTIAFPINSAIGKAYTSVPGTTDFWAHRKRLDNDLTVGLYKYFTKVLNPLENPDFPEDRSMDNQLYFYNGEKGKDMKLDVSYRYYYSAEKPNFSNGAPNTGVWGGANYDPSKPNIWETIGSITLKPHIKYLTTNGQYSSEPTPYIPISSKYWYRNLYSIDISSKTRTEGEYTINTTYKYDPETGEVSVLNEEKIKTSELPTNPNTTIFNAEMIGLSLPKFNQAEGATEPEKGGISISENPLLKLVSDANFNVNKAYLVELYKKIYGASSETDKDRIAAALLTYRDLNLVRRPGDMDDPTHLYGNNNLPYRTDVRNQIQRELASYLENAQAARSAVLVPNVRVRHWIRNKSDDGSTLIREEEKGPITRLDEYYTKGASELLEQGYRYIRAEHTDQQYIYKLKQENLYFDEWEKIRFNRVRYEITATETMGTVAPPFFAASGYPGSGFTVDYGFFPFVEAVSDERAEEVRNDPNSEYRVYDRARHVRTIDVYYDEVPTVTKTEEKGQVFVHYVDENGKTIKADKVYDEVVVNHITTTTYPKREKEVVTTPTNEQYDVEPDKDATITFENFEYTFKEVKDNVALSDTVPVGETHITYIYKVVPQIEEKEVVGSVSVSYRTVGGTLIKPKASVIDDTVIFREKTIKTPTSTSKETERNTVSYTTTAKDMEEVDGVTYQLVGIAPNSAPVTGTVKENEQEVIYLYAPVQEEVIKTETKGSVIVRYVDMDTDVEIHNRDTVVTDGLVSTETRTIKRYADKDGLFQVLSDDTVTTPTGATYDSSSKRLPTIDANGGTYYFVEVDKSETGDLQEGLTVITYKYRKPKVGMQDVTGQVTVHYVISGTTTVLKDPVETMKNTVVKSTTTTTRPDGTSTSTDVNYEVAYNTVPLAPAILTKDNVEYALVVVPNNSTGTVVEGNTDVTYEYLPRIVNEKHEEVKGSVVVHYVDEAGTQLQPNNKLVTDVVVKTKDTTIYRDQEEPVVKETNYDSPYTAHREEILSYNGKTYELVRVSMSNTVGEVDVVPSDAHIGGETGSVVEGVTDVIYVYREKQPEQPTPIPVPESESAKAPGSVLVTYVDETGKEIKASVYDEKNQPADSDYDTKVDNRPTKLLSDSGEIYELVPAGTYQVGTVDNDGHLVGTDSVTGMIVAGKTMMVTYVYKLKVDTPPTTEIPEQPESGEGELPPQPDGEKPGSYVPFVPNDPSNPDPKNPNPNMHIPEVPYDETPEDPSDDPRLPDVPGYIPVDPNDPTNPLPEDPNGGYVPPTPTDPKNPTAIPYVPAGSVTVHYVNEEGEVIKLPTMDTVKAPVGATYNTNEDGKEIPTEIKLAKETYVLVGVKDGDKETGTIVKGNIDVTYVYKLKVDTPPTTEIPEQPESGEGELPPQPDGEKPGSYVPFVPNDPSNPDPKNPNPNVHIPEVPYDETPEDPSDDPRLPDVPGYIPVDPNDPTNPLPEDPNGGYVPPTPTDPKNPTAIPYVPAGSVTVHYVNEEGEVIKLPTMDTVKAPVGASYNTNEDGKEIPTEIKLAKETYVLVGVKDGDKETGTIVKGNIDVTYVYKLKVDTPPTTEIPEKPESGEGELPPQPDGEKPGSYVPFVPNDPSNPDPKDPNPNVHIPEVPYDETPTDPSDDPRLPDVPGYIPVDPSDPTTPLPEDPNGGYIPPTPTDPKNPTAIPYVPAGSVTVHYVNEDGEVIKLPTMDTVKAPVGASYNTNEDGKEIPTEIKLAKETYVLVGVKEGDKETGTIVKGNIDVTYVYKLKVDTPPTTEIPEKPESGEGELPPQPDGEKPGSYVPFVPKDPSNPDPKDPNPNVHIPEVPYDETPTDPSDDPRLPDVPGYIPVDPNDPTNPLPEDPNGGYVPPTPTDPKNPTAIPYVPAGSVTVHYVNEDGEVIKLPTMDTVKAPVGATYNTNEDGKEIPTEIQWAKETYVLVGVKEGDKETGTIVKGNIDVTYVYKLKVDTPPTTEIPEKPESGEGELPPQPDGEKPGSYVPFVPKDPSNPDPKDPNPNVHIPEVPYDETPTDPSDDPRLPDVPGYIPVDPNDPTNPLPEDPNGGYVPPTPTDPKNPTAIPYVPAGSVTVHYVNEDGEVIKLPTMDTVKAPVGATYNTNEDGKEIPTEIQWAKETYVLVGVKEGDKETGTIVKGNIDVTYVYKLKVDTPPTTPEMPEQPNPKPQPEPQPMPNPNGSEEPQRPQEPIIPDKSIPGQPNNSSVTPTPVVSKGDATPATLEKGEAPVYMAKAENLPNTGDAADQSGLVYGAAALGLTALLAAMKKKSEQED
ncbi:MucBP domain-containing protein [Streptococcus pneumoniae]